MNQVIRILSFVQRLRDSNLRYKIVYRRVNYNGYNIENGDELDQAIFDYFNQKKPTLINWEFVGIDTGNLNLTHVLNTFTPLNIPLIITASLDNLTTIELDYIQSNNITFQIQNAQVTLFYRSNVDVTHENWIWLPSEVRFSFNFKTYKQFAQTIIQYQ